MSEAQLLTDLVDEIVICLVHTRIYRAGHQQVENAVGALRNRLGDLMARTGLSTTSIAAAGNYVVYQGRPLLGASLAAARLLRLFADRGVGGLELDREVSAGELRIFFETLGGAGVDLQVSAGGDPLRCCDAWNEILRSHGCRHARLLPKRRAQAEDPLADGSESGAVLPAAVTTYQSVVHLLQEMTISVCQGGTVDFGGATEHMGRLLDLLDLDADAILRMCRYERYDAFTFGHSIRVCLLASSLTASITRDPELRLRVGTAALLHDIGKSRVPFDVIHCQGRLSPEQRREMERHPEFGAEILLGHEKVDSLAVAAAFGHHQAGGGRGYPLTRHQAEQSLVTQIVKICDVFEALTAVRPYKDAMTAVRAYRIMMKMQPYFDPALFRRFIDVNGFYPIATTVYLSNGSGARVVRQTGDPRRPVVVSEPEAAAGLPPDAELRARQGLDTTSVIERVSQEVDLSDPRFERRLWIQKGGTARIAA